MEQSKAQLTKLRPHWDDDFVDKVNYFWTACILFMCSLTVGMKQYVGSPLECWVPYEFKSFWEDYAERYCFVENTYYVPMNESIPVTKQDRVDRELYYYQWVPVVLALQAFLFMLPRLIWQGLNTQGLSVPAIVQSALMVTTGDKKTQRIKKREQTENDNKVAAQYWLDQVNFRRALRHKTPYGAPDSAPDSPIHPAPVSPSSNAFGLLSLPFGYYATTVYLFVKIFYISNVIGQFFVTNEYLAPQYSWWGLGILNDLINGREWRVSGHFPRVTLCDFAVRKLGNLQEYTIQCVLILNMLNEKVYIFLWWWFFIVAITTIVNFIYWLYACLYAPSRRAFVAAYVPRQYSDRQLDEFVNSYLKPDGVLVLRLISGNAGEAACQMLVQKLLDQLYPAKKKVPLNALSDAPNETLHSDTGGFLESPDSSLSSHK